VRTLFRQPFSVAFGPMVRRVSCCRDRRGYQGLLGVLARPRALRVRGRVGECFAVREGRRRGSCWRGRSEQSWLVLFSWRGSGLGWALARQRGSMGLVGDSIWKPHRHCITRVRRWAPRKSAAIGPVLTRLRAAVASGSAGFIGSPQWMYSAPSCMTSSAVADRARIPATRTAVGAGAAASSAVKGGGEGFPPGIHDGDGIHEEVPVGIACRAPGLVSPGLVGVGWQVRAGGCVHAGQTTPG
jgi:hypothetical protein